MPGARKRTAPKPPNVLLKEQAAKILVSAMRDFLRRNGISEKIITAKRDPHPQKHIRHYRRFMRAWEYVGVLLGTWYSDPKFLDRLGNPIALAPRSITRLIRASHVNLTAGDALQLMRCSPSIKTNGDGDLVPLRRVFALPDWRTSLSGFWIRSTATLPSENTMPPCWSAAVEPLESISAVAREFFATSRKGEAYLWMLSMAKSKLADRGDVREAEAQAENWA
jgi:hypothetical protein